MEGYTKLANLMAQHGEMGILRQFKILNFKNLLYLQAELVESERELDQLCAADERAQHPTRPLYRKHWRLLSESVHDGNDEQWRKILQIRKQLKEYSKYYLFSVEMPMVGYVRGDVVGSILISILLDDCLAQQALLASLESPNKYDVELLRDWLRRPDMGDFPILSHDKDAWHKETEYDLIAISGRKDTDSFTQWVSTSLVPTFHALLGKRCKEPLLWHATAGVVHYSDSTINRILNLVGTILSSLFPIVSIVVLYLVNYMPARISIIAAFTAIFSLCLAVMTRARRVEIFAATTA
jgi:hypothetical protein